VQRALVARQSDSKNHFDLMNILHRGFGKSLRVTAARWPVADCLHHRCGEYRQAQLHSDVRRKSDL
jgi:hypothetical protein